MDIFKEGYIALFFIVTAGIALGKIKVKGFSLDISGVLFISLIMGHFGYVLPKDLMQIGLILFVFTIGMQAGPGFFGLFRKQGSVYALLAVVTIGSTALVSFLMSFFTNGDKGLGVGIFTGALTSTPGLAAATDISDSPLTSIGYGIAYPIGVIFVIILMNLIPKILKVDIKSEEEKLEKEFKDEFPDAIDKTFKIINPNVNGKTVSELKFREITGCVITRVLHENFAFTPVNDSVLYNGDYVRIVGTDENLKKAELFIGEPVDKSIPLSYKYDIRWVWVSNKSIVNKSYKEVKLSQYYNTRVAKIKRSGVDIIPGPKSHFRYGDKVLIAGEKENLEKVSKLLGNDTKKLSETDFLPLFFGIFIGILIGKVEIPFSNLFSFKLGNTGGVLFTGLILSRIGKTGPVVWSISGTANHILRRFGLLIFMASIGGLAGSELLETVSKEGVNLIFGAIILTIVPVLVGFLFGYYILKINFITLMGLVTGTMTSTPGLAVIQGKSSNSASSVAYAAVYPVALVLVIIFSQILAT